MAPRSLSTEASSIALDNYGAVTANGDPNINQGTITNRGALNIVGTLENRGAVYTCGTISGTIDEEFGGSDSYSCPT